MGRKKKRAVSDPASRIFCYYCDRTFQTEQTLVTHQREKHLRCPTCHKRMLSIPSMAVHSSQMHNITIAKVPNATPGRDDVHIEVLGMKGIPDSYYASLDSAPASKARRTTSQYPQAAAPGYAGYHTQQQYPYQNGAAPWPPQTNPSQVYPHNAYLPNTYAQPAYPHPSYPQQSTYPQAGYSCAPAAPYYYPYTHTSAQYAHPYHQQPFPPANRQYGHTVPHIAAPSSQQGSTPSQATLPPTQHSPQAPPMVIAKNAQASEQQKKDDVKVVFDRLDCSMEELRAKLPRYSNSS